jgi:hypothetical protein
MSISIIDGNNRFRALFEKAGPNALQMFYFKSISNDPTHKVIWVFDGENGNGLRRSQYPAYKGINKNTPTDAFWETMEFFKNLLKHSNCIQICVPGYEADDVIATLARGSKEYIEIDSSDQDFHSLICDRITTTKEHDLEPEFVRLYKTLVGDKSDNITGIKGYGESAWANLQHSERRLLIKHFEGGEKLTGNDVVELCGFKPAAAKFWDEQQDLLQTFWNIIGFYDVPIELIQQHLTAGVLNPTAAQEMLKTQFLALGAIA